METTTYNTRAKNNMNMTKYIMIAVAIVALCIPAQAVVYSNYEGQVGLGYPATAEGSQYSMTSSYTLDGTVTSSDSVRMFAISSGTYVRAVGYVVTEWSNNTNGAVTLNIGDSANAAGYISAGSATNGYNASSLGAFSAITVATNRLLGTTSITSDVVKTVVTSVTFQTSVAYVPAEPTAYAAGRWYNSNDYISVTWSGTLTNVSYRFFIDLVDLGGR